MNEWEWAVWVHLECQNGIPVGTAMMLITDPKILYQPSLTELSRNGLYIFFTYISICPCYGLFPASAHLLTAVHLLAVAVAVARVRLDADERTPRVCVVARGDSQR